MSKKKKVATATVPPSLPPSLPPPLPIYFCMSCQIGECRSSTHIDGGRRPVWQNMSRSVFTFYVPSTITLDHLTLTLDVINENRISDGFIGTTGSIGIDRVR